MWVGDLVQSTGIADEAVLSTIMPKSFDFDCIQFMWPLACITGDE